MGVPQKPDLDLITMVQSARLMHDLEATPSEVSAVYWIEAKCENCQKPTSTAGQWVLNTTLEKVDAVWEVVKQATREGKLGYKSKVSTSARSGNDHEQRVICVRTYDADDNADVTRIREALSTLVEANDWYYERDR